MKLIVSEPPEVAQLRRLPPAPYQGWGKSRRRLRTIGDARTEAARVYRAAAAGQMDPGDLSRAIYALDRLTKMIEAEQTEARIQALEAQLEEALKNGLA